jgi:hypothetical protein
MKTLVNVETNKSVNKFINSIKDETKREDSKKLVKIIQKITGKKPKIWGDNFFIAFGKYKYHRKNSKEEFEWFNIGFAPRKSNITLYLTCYLDKEPLIKKLGKCKFGKGCLYISKLDNIDLNVLKKLITKYKDGNWYS